MSDAQSLSNDLEDDVFADVREECASTAVVADSDTTEEGTLSERAVKKPLVRRLVVAGVFLAVCVGIVFSIPVGTLSSFGWESLAAICPLGALETMLAAKLLIPQALVFVLLVAIAVALLGKFFCSWVCPVPSVRSVLEAFGRKSPSIRSAKEHKADGSEVTSLRVVRPLSRREQKALASSCSTCASSSEGCATGCASHGACEPRAHLDSRHLILGGSLLSAAIFGFPVFCLVCPIGLTFATIIVFVQLFGLQTLSWGLLVFPLVLVLELTVLRKWCSRFCPMGALVSLLSLPNRFFRPKVDMTKCLRGKGVDCRICADVCAEGLDPHSKEGMHDCSKCRDCAVNCPAGAITFPLKHS